MDAIILAGGKGTRMNVPIPKALVEIQGMAIITRQIKFLKQNNIENIIVATGALSEQLIAYLKEHHPGVQYTVEEQPLGTGGAINLAMQKATSNRVLVFNCDDLTNIDIPAMEENDEHVIAVAHPRSPFGVVEEEDGYSVFREKPILQIWVNMGWYCFNRKEILPLLPEKGSVEYDVFPKIKMRLHKHEGYWGTTNSPKDQQERNEETLPKELQF